MITRPRNLPQADPDFDSVVLLAPFSGEGGDTSTTDLSDSVHSSITFNGTAALDSDIRKYGFTSLQLDGDSDYVRVPHSADWAFGTGDFTIECHVRFNALPNTNTGGFAMVSHYLNTGNDRSWWFHFQDTDELRFQWSVDGTNLQTLEATTTPALSTNTWYHAAVCRDGNNLRLYFEGVQVGTSTDITGDDLHDSATALDIGRVESVGFDNRYFNGWIENVRITKGVCRYPSGTTFTPPERAHPTVKEVAQAPPEIVSHDVTIVTANSNTDPITFTMPTTQTDDVVLHFWTSNGGASTYYLNESVTTDWTLVTNSRDFVGGDNLNGGVHYRVIDGTEDATYDWVTANINNKNYQMHVIVLRNLDPTAPFRVSTTTSHRDAIFNDSTPPMQDMSGHSVGDLILAFHVNSKTTDITTAAAPSGFTLFASDLNPDGAHDSYYFASQIATSTATISGNWDHTVSASFSEAYTLTLAMRKA